MKKTEQRTATELQEGLYGIDEYWPWPAEEAAYARLENYIVLSKGGESIRAAVDLSEQTIEMNVNTNGEFGPIIKMEAYLLLGTYRFTIGDEVRKVSKVYAFGTAREGTEGGDRDEKVANERLKMDYQRLRDANIEIEEKYFKR